ncbi:MAG: bestrophin family ion channel [Nostoc sp.]|uniref:bestrophin family protein n=1 Tax=Nostoc sp. TaxID=1180 RepID=UPI002FF0287F
MKRPNYFQKNSKNSLIEKYHLYKGEKLNWLQVTLRLERSIISIILPWVIFCTAYGILISFLDHLGLPIAFSNSNSILTNAVLSFNIGFTLLLVFRTNTAHDRFWEGRQLWGSLVNTSRNLTRGIWIIVKEKTPQDRREKEAILRLVTAFAVAMKLHLRSVPLDTQLASLVSEKQYLQLQDSNHPPLQIAYWIGDYLQSQHDRNFLNVYQLTTLHNCVDDLVDILGGCERILKTPLPLIYTIKLRQLLLIFCLILPLEIVSFLSWWTGIVMAFVSFTLLSIEQIGSEIEEPFGFDPNDLPLNTICNTISNNVEELIRLASNNVRSS